MVHIHTIKLWNGEKRYAVVAPITSTTKNKEGKMVSNTYILPVNYKSGEESLPAIFEHSKEGLAEAKEVQKLFK